MPTIPSDSDLLVEFTKWLFPQSGATDTADDNAWGKIVQDENQKRGKEYWFLPGTWGAIRKNPRNKIEVKSGTTLVCMVATSHATSLELPHGKTPDAPTLTELAKDVDDLWLNHSIKITHPDGRVEKHFNTLAPVTTPLFKATIDEKNGYAKIIGKSGANVPTVTIGRIHKFEPAVGRTKIVIASAAEPNPDVGVGEPEYNIQISYVVNTLPRGA